MNKKLLFGSLVGIILGFLVGYISSLLQSEALLSWYPFLQKPSFTPPGYIFPIAWGIIYICMGISLGLLLKSPGSPYRAQSITLWILQLVLNFFWSFLFFYKKNPLWGALCIAVLYIVVVLYILRSKKPSSAAAWLAVPYLAWLTLAFYLNFYVALYN